MTKFLCLFLFIGVCITGKTQDYSNKGRDFWLCFPSHVPTDITTLAKMGLFITSDKNSSGTVSVNGWSYNFTVLANQVTGPIDVPYSVANISGSSNGTPVAKGIRVTVDANQPPIVLYAHIYADARSEASLILPVNVLGKKYFSMNYYQDYLSVSKGGRSQFDIVATEPNTTIQYQLRLDGILDPVVHTVFIPNAGDVVQVQNTKDLTGSVIESISTATETCKKIAVFSGSSAVFIQKNGCNYPNVSSMDPLFQQCYATNSWGKNYGVLPLAGNPGGFHARVVASEDNTLIDFGGTSVLLNAGECYPATVIDAFAYSDAFSVTADKPICLAEYMMSVYCATGIAFGGNGDPDMVILNPIEQNISDISLFSSNLEAIHNKYISVYIKTIAAGSFRINGASPSGSFIPITPNNGYSYLTQELPLATQGFRLTADSGFNAIAYGLGTAESYAYSAGTFVKNRYQYLSTDNNGILTDKAISCVGTAFTLYSVFPFQPAQITWDFNGLFPNQIVNNPVYESTVVVDGKTLYRYKLSTPFTINIAGFYPIKVKSVNTSANGCSGVQEADYDLEIMAAPVADFSFVSENCNAQNIHFTGQIDAASMPGYKWFWSFSDGGASSLQSPLHAFALSGSFTADFYSISNLGCRSNTVSKNVVVQQGLSASFTLPSTFCKGENLVFVNTSSIPAGTVVQEIKWNFGDNTPDVVGAGNMSHVFTAANIFTVRLSITTDQGCSSSFAKAITIDPLPQLSFMVPVVCFPDGQAVFTAQSDIAAMNYNWAFSDGGTVLNNVSANHVYANDGNYSVALSATSTKGCAGSVQKNITVLPAPVASFATAATEIFSGNALGVTNTTVPVSGIQDYIWSWGDGNTQTVVTNLPLQHTYYASNETLFTIHLTAVGVNGCKAEGTSVIRVKPPTQLPLPVIPNAFSPNGDGVNDYWEITGLNLYAAIHISVYNRYGQLVYLSTNYNQPWNGSFKEKKLPIGTYYYVLDLKKGGKKLSGSVAIIK